MEITNVEKKTVVFESVTLFNELVTKGQIKNLVWVKSNPYPRFCIKRTDNVMRIIASFMAEHDLKCDRSVDDWSEFENTIINAETKLETIVTRNLEAVKKIVAEGYGYMLKRTGVDQYKKKFFVFYINDRIVEIKNEEDLKSRERFNSKHSNTKQEIANTQISQLLKKVMEERK